MQIRTDASVLKFLSDLDRINASEQKIQGQISSGYRVSRPSDATARIGHPFGAIYHGYGRALLNASGVPAPPSPQSPTPTAMGPVSV